MTSTIKRYTKDTVGFILILTTGAAIGWVIALATITLKLEHTSISLADIGGVLAGLSTLGLLYIAIKTSSSWKLQLNESAKQASLDEFYEASLLVNQRFMELSAHLKASRRANTGAPGTRLATQAANELKSVKLRTLETRMKQQASVSKVFVHWSGLEIPGTTPLDMINYEDKIEQNFEQFPPDQAFENSTAIIENFEKLLFDTYCKYGHKLIHKP